jgi:uncharacterized surface protein with fasciclin (FAS1) repeats
MKLFTKTAAISLAMGILSTTNVAADHKSSHGIFGVAPAPQCNRVDMIDVRGNGDIDGALGDGKDGMVTIAEVAVVNPLDNLGALVGAVLAADPLVLNAIADPSQSLTVFAPTDDAFAAVPEEVLNGIVDSGALTDVLLYHVIAGERDPRKGAYLRTQDSLLGQFLVIKRGRSNPTVNQSNVNCKGVYTDNGMVWLLDSVLIPQF